MFKATDTAGHGNCYGDAVIQGSLNNAAELKDLKMRVQKARHFIDQSEPRVEAIKATIFEIEIFYPEIKITRRPAATGKDDFSVSVENALLNAA